MINQIIHIDGADKTGKDTIRNILVKKSEGKYLVYVRSFISQIVYSRIYDRKINELFFWHKFRSANRVNDEKFFLLTCSVEEAKKRFIEHNEKDIHIDRFEYHQEKFLEVAAEAIYKYGIVINVIDTSLHDFDYSYNEINSLL